MINRDNDKKTLSVVVPVYFNEGSLPQLFKDFQVFEERLKELNVNLEIIFVNDGSGDNSLIELLKIKQDRPETKVITFSRNFGAVAASKTGFKYVTGDAFIIVAADLQDPIEQVLLMVEHWIQGARFVISVRKKRVDPLITRFFANIYYKVVKWLIVEGYPKGGFDLMLMDKIMLPYMVSSVRNTNPNMYAYWLGFKPVVLSYERRKRLYGKSRWSFRKKVNFFIDTLCGFSTGPLRVISTFGIGVASISFLYGFIIIFSTLLGNKGPLGFATIVILISFFSGLLLALLAVIGEYLWRIFDAVSQKPESVIDETYL